MSNKIDKLVNDIENKKLCDFLNKKKNERAAKISKEAGKDNGDFSNETIIPG